MAPLLRLERVSLTLMRGRRHYVPVLAEVSLDVHAGELLAIFAARAEGKTTLLRVAAGFDRPDQGRVLFNGEDLWHVGDRGRSALLGGQIALVEHRRPDLDLTARELVALPLMRHHGRRGARLLADEVLRHVGIAECALQRWESMADYERALLTLSRGVARSPRLLLIDDVMNGLGLGVSDRTGRLLRGLAEERQMSVVMSVPDLHATAWCDRVASLAGGALVVPDEDDDRPDGTVIEFPGDSRWRASS